MSKSARSSRAGRRGSAKAAAKTNALRPKASPDDDRELSSVTVTAPTAECPVVGVGASAGGLEAFTELLKHLPKNTGLAFALVQHLDPHHESQLTDILSRATAMPVAEVKDGIRLQPDHVYVIPPNASMSISEGVLKLGRRGEGGSRHMPVDQFFQSLAEDRGNKAIGIVLSGTASDGTLGLKAIKAAGGIAFAQAEASAKFPGMPRSAIDAGCVDFVLPPDRIATELARLGAHPYVTAVKDERRQVGKDGDSLKKIFELLRANAGVEFSNYRQTTIQRRIERRMVLQDIDSIEDYVAVLEKSGEEVRTLFREILIHVTSFFREPETFETLQTQIFPALLKKRRPEETIRIWVPGCSTGEEAYSLAISLVESFGDNAENARIQVFGTDVSERFVELARKGVFDESIETHVSPERLRRFFTKGDHGYQINKAIRELCLFARQNVIKDPPFSKLDLISCRNVLIYFEAFLQKKLIPLFHYALKPNGLLLLGSAETVGSFSELFTIVDKKNKIYTKRPHASTVRREMHFAEDLTETRSAGEESGAAAQPEVWSRLDIHKEADRVLMSKYCPPGVVLDNEMEIIQFRGQVAAYLEPAPGEASLHLFKMMRPGLEMELRSAILSARKSKAPVNRQNLHIESEGQSRHINLEVIPLGPPAVKEECFIVLFEELPPAPAEHSSDRKGPPRDRRTMQLEEELAAAKEHLQSMVEEQETANEELRSANEEIQSSNEELQSTNEELETAKEELQSTNEELTTLNEELKHNNADLSDLNNDLNNLLRSVNLPVVILGRDLRIRRFTPLAQKTFKLIPSDMGRAITDIKADIDMPDLEQLVREVIDTLSVKELELRDRQNRWHLLQVRPYETVDNKIAGAVMILFDIDVSKRCSEQVKHAAKYADAIIETVRDPLVVLDAELRVRRVTSSFCKKFRVTPEDSEGRLFYDLGNGQWNIPALRSLLEEVLPRDMRIDDFKVKHKNGGKPFAVNARRVDHAQGGEPLIVLSIQEVNE